ncbi:copper chaperone PCu(A)C [Chitinimonas sp. PSY-7]|uniref:copper chaperone PCu(A)C n=1 Tax=Chitinimonas sp. PSY-7 TaxID=3459088 RepID=UPI0040400AB8
MKSRFIPSLIVATSMFMAASSHAHGFKQGGLEVHHPWARATAAGSQTGAVYFKVNNGSSEADTLLGATATDVAEKAEIHNHVNDNGVMRMRQVEKVEVPSKGNVMFKPGGYHVMLFNLKNPLQEGGKVPLTLNFAKAGEVKVEVKIEPLTASAEAMHSGH